MINSSNTTYNSTASGGSKPHNNMPPYYTLCYIIKVANDGDAVTSNTYSTEEQVIGTWIDGKPVYRRVVEVESIASAATGLVLVEGADALVGVGGNILNDTNICVPFPYYFDTTTVTVRAISGNAVLYLYGSIGSFRAAKIVLEYIKTTD